MLLEECKSGLDGHEMRHEIEKLMRMIRMWGGPGRAMGLWRRTACCRVGLFPGYVLNDFRITQLKADEVTPGPGLLPNRLD